MAKDPTQGPVTTYDEFGNPVITNVDAPVEEEVTEAPAEETAEEEVAEEVIEEEAGEETPDESGEDADFRVESADGSELHVEQVDDFVMDVEETPDEEPVVEEESEEETPDEEPVVEEESEEETPDEEPDEEELETHEDAMPAPLTYNEAETALHEMPFLKLRELAIADEIKPGRSKVQVVQQLLDIWFKPSEVPQPEEEPEMSVRIRRIKGLS